MERQQLRGYTTGELAEEAGITPGRIRQLILERKSGPFPGAIKRDWQWFIPSDEAEIWLAARQRP